MCLTVPSFLYHVTQVELARKHEDLELFRTDNHPQFALTKARSKKLNCVDHVIIIHLSSFISWTQLNEF